MQPYIDLNADLGEGAGADDALLQIVTSASVCCGAYAGSAQISTETALRARELGVCIGAHVGYPDRTNFGRAPFAMSTDQLRSSLEQQLAVLLAAVGTGQGGVSYVKPHGALYHACSDDPEVAAVVVALAESHGLGLLHQRDSRIYALAEAAGVRRASEGFADRRYRTDGRLVPRTESHATIALEEEALAQAVGLALGVGGFQGVDSLCVHGDHAGALELASAVRARLELEGLQLRAQFC